MNKCSLIFFMLMVSTFKFLVAQETGTNSGTHDFNAKELKKQQAVADKYLSEYRIDQALEIYQRLVGIDPENANYNFKTGLCYLYSFDKHNKAIPYFKNAAKDITLNYLFFDKDQRMAPVDALYFLGKSYMTIHEPDSAIKYINLFSQESMRMIDKFNYIPSFEVFSNISKCNFANKARYCRFNIVREVLTNPINSSYSETNPVVYDGGKQLFFCSNREKNGVEGTLNIYHSILVKGKWSDPTPFAHTGINNEFPVFVNTAGDEFYFSRENAKGNYDLFVSYKVDSKWGTPEKVKGKINSEYDDVGLTINRDLSAMVISSNRKGGLGGFDLYVLKKQSNGSWGKPENLESVNTNYDERSPFFSENGDTLFYTSNGEHKEIGLGGFDVYFTPFLNIEAGKPNCLKYPVNTVSHDRNISITPQKVAYFSSINAENNFDIYIIQNFTTDIKLTKVYKSSETAKTLDTHEAGNIPLQGGKTNQGIVNEIQVLENFGYVNASDVDDLDKIIATEIVEKEVQVEVEKVVEREKEVERLVEVEKVVEREKEVERLVEVNNIVEVEKIVEVIKEGKTKIEYVDMSHLSKQEKDTVVREVIKVIELEKKPSFATINLGLQFVNREDLDSEQKQQILSKLQSQVSEREAEYNLTDSIESGELLGTIDFGFNTYTLSSMQIEEIQQLSTTLAGTNKYYIEVVGHCDSAGDESVNKQISFVRATEVAKQFEKCGIPKGKIISYGRGSFEPVANNDTNEGRSKNRRVEIIIHTKNKEKQNVSLKPD